MNRLTIAALLAMSMTAAPGQAAAPALIGDGWHTWRVDAVADAPDWCCYLLRNDTATPERCDLDSGHHGYGSSSDRSQSPTHMQLYVRTEAGKPVELRTLSTTCPVSTNGNIADHGEVATNASVDLLKTLVSPRSELSGDALAAIAVHAGNEAGQTLRRTARSDTSRENRKDAVFWMGQVRAREMADDIRALMFDDPDPKMREHAAFSWSQSNIANRGDALIELATIDAAAKVRGQAWFWLAQTADAKSETAILATLLSERNRKTREQAIFALSQLPDERAVQALIAVIEDRRLAASDRKQALFWMAQSESDRALHYLASVLEL